jgi:lipase chaperone LimK
MSARHDHTAEDARNRRAWWSVAIAALVACGVWGWTTMFRAGADSAGAPSGQTFPWSRADQGTLPAAPGPTASTATGRSASELAADPGLQANASGHLLVTRALRDTFDAMLGSQQGPLVQRRTALVGRINQRLKPPAAAEAIALLDRYLAYENAIQLPPPGLDADGAMARLYIINGLRERYFSAVERTAFFGDDIALARHNLSRQQTLADHSISLVNQARLLREMHDALPASLRARLGPDVMRTDTTSLTTAWREQGGSPAELREIRQIMLGADDADQLEARDRISDAWKQQQRAYSAQRRAVKQDPSLSDAQRQQSLDRLQRETQGKLEQIQQQADHP